MIDTHCHLADPAFADDLPEVVARARAAGLERALCILSADESEEVARAGEVRTRWPDAVFAAGVHPHRAAAFAGRELEAAQMASAVAEVLSAVAIGEIGLDYHYEFAPHETQRAVFAAQIDAAMACGRPIVVHTRDATEDTVALLRNAGPALRGVIHCFTGTVDEARLMLDCGFFISLAGIVTFPKAQSLRAVAAFVPDDRLLVETDAPYLAPVPHRGKRNEPAWVQETLGAVAIIRHVDAALLGQRVVQNFAQFVGPAAPPTR